MLRRLFLLLLAGACQRGGFALGLLARARLRNQRRVGLGALAREACRLALGRGARLGLARVLFFRDAFLAQRFERARFGLRALAHRAPRLLLGAGALPHRRRRLRLGLGALARVLRRLFLLLLASQRQRGGLALGLLAGARLAERGGLGALALVHDPRRLGLGVGARIGDAAQLALGGLALARELERAPLLGDARVHPLLRDALGLDAQAQVGGLAGALRLALAFGFLQLVVQLAHLCFFASARALDAASAFGAAFGAKSRLTRAPSWSE
jgi:hypothetical protein